MRGNMVPADIYDAAVRERDAFRKTQRQVDAGGRGSRRKPARHARARRHHAAAARARSRSAASSTPEFLAPPPFTLNLTLWVGLLGAAIAAREGKLLTLATGEFLPKGRIADAAHVVGGFAGAAIAMMFAVGGLALVATEREAGDDHRASACRVWVSTLAFPDRLHADRAAPGVARRRRTGPAAPSPRLGIVARHRSRRSNYAVLRRARAVAVARRRFSWPACSARRSSRCSAASR